MSDDELRAGCYSSTHQLFGLLVKTELLLQDEGLVVRKRESDDVARKCKDDEEEDGMRNVPVQVGGCVLSKPDAGDVPELGVKIEVDNGDVGGLAKERVGKPELRLGS